MSATANTISSISQPLPTLGGSAGDDLVGSPLRQLSGIGGHPGSGPGGPPPGAHHLPPYHSALGAQDSCNKSEEDNADIECVVCGDKSSGKHYGQFTCEGKPIFFNYIYYV